MNQSVVTMNEPSFPWLAHYPSGLNWHAPLETGPVPELLEKAAARFPNRPFLDFLGKKTTYAEGLKAVRHIATSLQALGIGKGQRIGLMLPNCPYFVLAYYAILKTGATVVNFNPLYAEHELKTQIIDSGVTLMFTLDFKAMHDKLLKVMPETQLKRMIVCPFVNLLKFPQNILFPPFKGGMLAIWHRDPQHLAWDDLLSFGDMFRDVPLDPAQDVAVLQYTGGTTGTPKGAVLTHANLTANASQCAHWFISAVPGAERVLGVIPLFHVFSMTVVMNLGVKLGAEIVLLPRFELVQLLKTIHKTRPTLFPAVPTIYNAILNHPKLSRYNLRSVRECISGGAPLPLEVKEQFESLTGCRLVEGYGLSETSPVAACNPLYGVNKAGAIGLPLPGTVLEIMSLENPDVPAEKGTRGELTIKGPQVMKGYWNKLEETAKSLRNGRFYTGDVATMDEEGYFYIVDRIKDMIIASGYKVYPRNVEEAIYLNPAVAECVVAGIPDQYRGQTVKAYLKLKEGQTLTEPDLIAFLKDKISPLEMPKLFEFRDNLPKTMIGKLDRKALLEEEAKRKS